MSYQDEISMLKLLRDTCYQPIRAKQAITVGIQSMEKLQEYEQIGTLKEVREAVEKQIPKKPTLDKPLMILECPSCGNYLQKVVDNEGSTEGFIPNYCKDCGQKIDADWSETDD